VKLLDLAADAPTVGRRDTPNGETMPTPQVLRCVLVALAAVAATGAGELDLHYLVVREKADGTAVPVFHLVSPAPGADAIRLGALGTTRPERLTLRSSAGDLLTTTTSRPVPLLRGEFHAGSTHGSRDRRGIDGHVVPRPGPAWTVRAVAPADAWLVTEGPRHTEIRLDPASDARDAVLAKILTSSGDGPASNRVDLVILGDGYTADEEADFLADAAELERSFFDVTPYREYANLFNVTSLFVASPESGADHPPYRAGCAAADITCCGDADARSDTLAGTFVETAFDARYCTQGIHRLLTVDEAEVLAAAARVPDWDAILVVVNDDTYGGSGGLFSVVSTHPLVVDVARHEWGHSFTDLADEYESPYPGYPDCSDAGPTACEANVTDETRRDHLKWSPWVAPATPIPTPETGAWEEVVGLFEGARYQSSAMFRPRQACLMRVLDAPFCEVCAEEFVRVLYRGGWGDPADGIDLIEPGSEAPPPGPVTISTDGVALEIRVLRPVGGSDPEISWWVDGTRASNETGESFTYRPTGSGRHSVEVRVRDTTPLVHEERGRGELTSSRRWEVEAAERPRRPGGRRRPSGSTGS
jgi:hypothetical protein